MHRPRFRPLLLTTTALLTASVTALGVPMTLSAQTLNSYGMPGAIDTPTAVAPAEGQFSADVSYSDYGRRVTTSFQVLPRLTTALRYSRIKGIDPNRDALYDRSFDIQFQVFEESGWRPSVAVGLRDFLGTGIYSSEYLVATKQVTPAIRVSGGIGWGRLAGAWRRTDYNDEGGKPKVEDWFSGPARPFASIEWQATDKLSVLAEYSNDDYEPESDADGTEPPDGRLNLGVNYRLGDTYQIGAYTIGGDTFGIRASVALNARQPQYPSGLEPAPAPVRPRPSPAADPEGWSGAWSADPTAQPAIQTALSTALAKEGQVLESMSLSANRAEIRIRNTRYPIQAEAIGRAARLMTRALPPSVETFVITSMKSGIATSSVELRRSDVEALENTAAARIAQRANILDAKQYPGDLLASPGIYPKFSWRLAPYGDIGLFDPDEPLRYELGAELSGRYEILPGLILKGRVRQRVLGTQTQKAPKNQITNENYSIDDYLALDAEQQAAGNNGVPRVRSDTRMFAGNGGPTVPELTLAWYAHPTPTTYTRVTAGMIERAFGGVSAEALWKPVDSRLALGAEVNRVRKRDFDSVLGFQDYEVTTGHVSAYYDFGNGIWGQVDVGKYLAGDKGATVSLNREFANGWRIGAYATKTNLSDEQYGEGSFDKGITMSVPLTWALGTPSTQRVTGDLRSLSRDGGSRLRVDGRLYETVRETHSGKLYEGWGRFWR